MPTPYTCPSTHSKFPFSSSLHMETIETHFLCSKWANKDKNCKDKEEHSFPFKKDHNHVQQTNRIHSTMLKYSKL
jgi:hypothetical protein